MENKDLCFTRCNIHELSDLICSPCLCWMCICVRHPAVSSPQCDHQRDWGQLSLGHMGDLGGGPRHWICHHSTGTSVHDVRKCDLAALFRCKPRVWAKYEGKKCRRLKTQADKWQWEFRYGLTWWLHPLTNPVNSWSGNNSGCGTEYWQTRTEQARNILVVNYT